MTASPRPIEQAPDALAILEVLETLLADTALVAIDARGRVLSATDAALDLVHLSRDELIGQRWTDVTGASADLSLNRAESPQERVLGAPDQVGSVGSGEERIHLELHLTAASRGGADRDQEQLLKYAMDVANSWSSEREKARELAEALGKLETVFESLRQANEQLARQHVALEAEAAKQADELQTARAQLRKLGDVGETTIFHGMVSGDPTVKLQFETVKQIARSGATVLVQGESGTGKELVARAIHAESRRAPGPFVAINCASLAPSLAESLLFGHEKGSFTGAVKRHDGVFVQASGGTLFLDEVAELTPDIQAALLRVIQEREVRPVGASTVQRVDVRIVSATHRELDEQVRAGRFREDLMYRLNVVPIRLPPLRERRGDVEVLLRYMLPKVSERGGGAPVTAIAPAAVRRLLAYPWPGNVRELENTLQHACAVGTGARIEEADLPEGVRSPADVSCGSAAESKPLTKTQSDEEERIAILDALAQSGGRINEAAKRLGVSRATFFRKRRRLLGETEAPGGAAGDASTELL